ncbi:sialic acid-binding Ig-like lectin 5 isoform X2 [Prionailurus viverrinus]|nr:sialic acid-binding Ig-like lectin 5 isoform X2 [Prionailurus viverrinus]XP_047690883.1 sialic acid-binding Ig-like lectin 5 isoform X2 [Prionailurus viverrinus]XP_047690884.1 sialic acid-binding Ig-like lectin 5 isoform X2 [Prionailurus viverrinus]XP_047690885.1 sialic acid-binding Ig-like lectin 5 isoform X2 [Prionailurus viverrinus]XP_047690886.1 sialic acid-binding Ig-like lectin 5 isoform X2 [Prionailurus viverrinus]
MLYIYWFREKDTSSNRYPVATNNPQRTVRTEARGRFCLVGDPWANNCSLRIRDAMRSDEGVYFFRVERENVRYTYTHTTMTLRVAALTQEPDIHFPEPLKSGWPAELTCSLPGSCEGGRPLTFSWVGAALDSLDPETLHSSVVTFTPRPQDHGTKLTCQVKLPEVQATVERTIWLNVSYAPHNLTISIFSNVTGRKELSSWGLGPGLGWGRRLPPCGMGIVAGMGPDKGRARIKITTLPPPPCLGAKVAAQAHSVHLYGALLWFSSSPPAPASSILFPAEFRVHQLRPPNSPGVSQWGHRAFSEDVKPGHLRSTSFGRKAQPLSLVGPKSVAQGRRGRCQPDPGTEGDVETAGLQQLSQCLSLLSLHLSPKALRILENTSSLLIWEGQALRLLCAAASNPPAELSWFRGSPALNATPMYRTHILELPQVGAAEEGTLTCRAQNSLGSQHVSLRLSVVCPPRLLGPSCSWEGEALGCTCSARARPAPTLRWRLGEGLLKGNHSDASLTVTSSSEGPWANSSLSLRGPLRSDLRLGCEARNEHGTQSTDAVLVLLPGKSLSLAETATAAVGGAGAMALLCLCLCLLVFWVVKARRKQASRSQEGMANEDPVMGTVDWGSRKKPWPDSPPDQTTPAGDAPPSGEQQELHYASFSFHGIKMREPQDQEATSTSEYSEIRRSK